MADQLSFGRCPEAEISVVGITENEMREIDLIPAGDSGENAAFCREKMDEAGVDSISLSEAIHQRLGPIASLLRNGKGIALIIKEDGDASVIGVDLHPTHSL